MLQVCLHLRISKLATNETFAIENDHAIGDDKHDPDHPQENADAASWIINIR
jgi:hypothetical protein